MIGYGAAAAVLPVSVVAADIAPAVPVNMAEQTVRWLPADLWNSCNCCVDEEKLKGKQCFVGFDLMNWTDIAGYLMLFPPDDDCGLWRVLPRFFIPRDNAEKRENCDKVPYLKWARGGFITLTEGNVIDHDAIKESLWSDAGKFEIVDIAIDRWEFKFFCKILIAEGIDKEKFVAFGQGFYGMSAPTKELKKLLLVKKLAHGGHPVLKWMAGNVTVETAGPGVIKPSRTKSKEKINGIIMLIMALGRAKTVDLKSQIEAMVSANGGFMVTDEALKKNGFVADKTQICGYRAVS